MNKQEKQKMMEAGAVFQGRHIGVEMEYSYRGVHLDHMGGQINDSEWENMTLKTPATTKEYSTEYEIIPPHRMAYLMEVEGLTLESKYRYLYYNKNTSYPYWSANKDGGDPAVELGDSWTLPCRVRQEPKTETRWFWTRKSYAIDDADLKTNVKKIYPPIANNKWVKVQESAEEFEVEQ